MSANANSPALVSPHTRRVDAPADTSSRLHGRWLWLARGMWFILALTAIALFVTALQTYHAQLADLSRPVRVGFTSGAIVDLRPALGQAGIALDTFVTYHVALEAVYALVFCLVGFLIFARRSNDRLALFASLMLIIFGTAGSSTIQDANIPTQWKLPASVLAYVVWLSIFIFLYTFPNGRFAPRWTLLAFFYLIPIELLWNVFPDSPYSPPNWQPLPYLLLLFSIWSPVLFAFVYRYRRVLNPLEQQQTKWVVYGFLVAFGIFAVCAFLDYWVSSSVVDNAQRVIYQFVTVTGFDVALLIFPLSIMMAMLRYRLYDVDILINRTLVYLPLTGILTGIYAAVIAFTQTLAASASNAALVLTTVLVVAAFEPLRAQLQGLVDRRFREAPDPAKQLNVFRETVHTRLYAIDATRGMRRLLQEAVSAFEAEGGAVLWDIADGARSTWSIGQWNADANLSVPVQNGTGRIATLALGARRNGREYSTRDRELLQQIATVVAQAIEQDSLQQH